jgi:hypothetical protein
MLHLFDRVIHFFLFNATIILSLHIIVAIYIDVYSIANKNRFSAVVLHFGGDEESRTPVQEVSHIQSSTV